MSTAVATDRLLLSRAREVLRRAGNPFRNYFARNPDDEVCSRFHVPELFGHEREQLLRVVDLYRYHASTHSEIIPVLGNKGAGKTHLLHSIKHGADGAWQLLVTPGTYQRDNDFLEYLLFQIIDTLLGGGKQKGRRPLEFISEDLGRKLLHQALSQATREEQLDLFPAPGLGKWTRLLGLGASQAQERTQWLMDSLSRPGSYASGFAPLRRICAECDLAGERACELVCRYVERTESHATAGIMRRQILQGFARAALLGDESELASFLTYGFAELDFKVQPSRQDLVLSLFKVLMEVLLKLKVPVVVAFDQLEDLLLVRRNEEGHRMAEAFFAGMVQVMHQIDGICFLVFAERGLWNRFVPSLDGYIQDRLNNPIHVPGHGTIKALRLEAPPAELVRMVVEARLRPALEELPDFNDLPPLFPFTEEQVQRVARTEPTLRDMLQQYRHLFDHVIYGEAQAASVGSIDEGARGQGTAVRSQEAGVRSQEAGVRGQESGGRKQESQLVRTVSTSTALPPEVKSLVVVETVPAPAVKPTAIAVPAATPAVATPAALPNLNETWEQQMKAARNQLAPEGALTAATRELQAGLGAFLQACHEHGVKVGPWRLQHVVGEWTFGEHPTYGVLTIGHWVCKDGQPWKVGIGLFLGRGPGKPKDMEVKLSALEMSPPVIDHLILLRPADDMALTGKSKTLWHDAEKRGRHGRLEAVGLDEFSVLYGFPRWLAAVGEALPNGQPLPNLADLIQDRCEKLLEQVCMPACP